MTAPIQASTPERASPHWANLPEHTFVFGIRLMYWIYRCLGLLPFRTCLYPVVLYYWASRRAARRASMEYLQRVQVFHGAVGHKPDWRDSLRHFLGFADAILDKLLAVHGNLSAEVRREGNGESQLREALSRGCGAMVLTGHIGCMELCRIQGEQQGGVRLNVLVHTRHAERFNRLLQRLNPANEVHFIQVTEVNAATAMLLADRLARGEILAMAADRIPVRLDDATSASGTVTASFLGHDAQWPIGPYLLASLFKCPLFAVACVRRPHGYVMHIDRLAELIELPRHRRHQALTKHAQQFADWLGNIVATSPWAWFNFFPFWRQVVPTAPQPHEPSQPN